MRRGQTRSETLPHNTPGWSKQDLMDASGLSAKSFDTIRKAARVSGPNHGGLNWLFNADDVHKLIHRAESGSFTERGFPAATGWRALLSEAGLPLPPVSLRKR